MTDRNPAIGVFDSGLGGASVLRELRRLLPAETFLYVADQAHIPYGRRSLEEVERYVFGVARWLFAGRAKAVVIACNTASAAALRSLREAWPERLFIGMEPAVKPAATTTRTGNVGVLATAATFEGRLFESVVERFAEGVRVFRQTCPGLVEAVEAGDTDSPALVAMLEGWIAPLREAGIDRLVLGCTHYPLAVDAIRRVAGPGIEVIDPSEAVARRTASVLAERGLLREDGAGGVLGFTTGDAAAFRERAGALLGEPFAVESLAWNGGHDRVI